MRRSEASLRTRLALTALLMALSVGSASHAADPVQTIRPDYACQVPLASLGNCTASEIKFSIDNPDPMLTTTAELGETICFPGDLVDVHRINSGIELNTQARYDLMLWVSKDEVIPVDPDDKPNQCFVTTLPLTADQNIFQNLEEGDPDDSCLDVANANDVSPLVFEGPPDPEAPEQSLPLATATCLDRDNDGIADLDAILTWHSNQTFTCPDTANPGMELLPGQPPKCDRANIPTSTHMGAKLTVQKICVPANDDGLFNLSISGEGVNESRIDVDCDPNDDDDPFTIVVKPGTYTVSESAGTGTDLGDYTTVISDPCAADGTITLAAGEAKTCTITNTRIPPATLQLVKNVVNDDGGTAGDNDFGLSIGGLPVASGEIKAVEPGVPVAVNETGLAGYQFISITGSGCPASLGGTVTAGPGEAIICTITNDDIAPTLTLTKAVLGGEAGPDDFGISVGGSPVTSGQANSYPANIPLVIDEQGLEGYLFSAISGDAKCPLSLGGSVTLALAEQVSCTITNVLEPDTSLRLVKNVINDDGGTAGVNDFGLSIDGMPVVSGEIVAIEPGVPVAVDEVGLAGYAFVSITGAGCPANLGGTVTAGLGEAISCTITNDDIAPTLALGKQVINNNGGAAEAGDFTLLINGQPVPQNDPQPQTANQLLQIGEIQLAGYELTGAQGDTKCPGLLTGTETLALDEHVTCTLVNDDLPGPTVTLVKAVMNDDGGTAGPDDFGLSIEGKPATSGVPITISANQPVPLNEEGLAGYAFDSITGDGCPASLGGTVNLDFDEHITCTITNDDIAPTLELRKQVINDNQGTAEPGDFTLLINGQPVPQNAPQPQIANQATQIGEQPFGGYTLADVTGNAKCAGLLAGTESLDLDEDVVCTLVNDDPPQPTITLTKVVINDHGGTATANDFGLSVGGGSASSDVPVLVTEGQPIAIDEAGLDGYEFVSITGAGCPASLGGTVTLGADENLACTITNDDIAGRLTLVKIVDGGDAAPADFTLSAAGPTPISGSSGSPGVTDQPVAAGAYTLSEDGPKGYVPEGWACNGQPLPGNTVAIGLDEQVTCEVTNTPSEGPTLTLVKQIEGNAGQAGPDDFGISVNGEVVLSGVAREYAAGLPLTLNEAGLDGFEFAAIDGDGCPDGLGGAVTLEEDQHLTCTIVNRRKPGAVLTLRKAVVNDDDGTAQAQAWTLVANGPVTISGTTGSPAITAAEVPDGLYQLSESQRCGYESLGWDCAGGLLTGSQLLLQPGEEAVCTITNDDVAGADCPTEPAPDLQITKSWETVGDCRPVVGKPVQYLISIGNEGSAEARNVVLIDRLKGSSEDLVLPVKMDPEGLPEELDCEYRGEAERKFFCRLGKLAPGDEIVLGSEATAGDGRGCNVAVVRGKPTVVGAKKAIARACFTAVPAINVDVGFTTPVQGEGEATGDADIINIQLPTAVAGRDYPPQAIAIRDARKPVTVSPDRPPIEGLPPGMSARFAAKRQAIVIEGFPQCPGESSFILTVSDRDACQTLELEFEIEVIPAACRLSEVTESQPALDEVGTRPPGPPGNPDESLQKLAIDDAGNRYLAGFVYGPYLGASATHYNLRVVKVSPDGEMLWEQVYDSGNHDFGYAIAHAAPDGAAGDEGVLLVGGASLVEEPGRAWHEAVLLEIAPDSGAIVGAHRESCGPGTTSVFYDIDTRWPVSGDLEVFAVGERQVDATRTGTPVEVGGLVSRFGTAPAPAGIDPITDACPEAETFIASGPGLQSHWRRIREGEFPTRAYSIQVPAADCDSCQVYIGGIAGEDGWLDTLDAPGLPELAPFKGTGFVPLKVQDIVVSPGLAGADARLLVAGSDADGDMTVVQLSQDAQPDVWYPTHMTDRQPRSTRGLFRGIADDAEGSVYAAGVIDDNRRTGVLIKFDANADIVNFRELAPADGDGAFHDVVTTRIGAGAVAGEVVTSGNDHRWLQAEFECEGGTPDCD